MPVKKIVTTKYVDDEDFEFVHEPVEDSLKIKRTRKGYEARYLVVDTDAQQPENDDNAFLVHYHRDFEVRRDGVVAKDELADLYHGKEADITEHYWIFWTAALIHSGVWLKLSTGGFAEDPGGWDTSHCGAVLIAKEEWPTEDDARKYAEGIIEQWNQYLSGDVYGIVKETYNKEKEQFTEDACWGFYGRRWAEEALETEL
jgi:hypothetical protein